MAKTLNIQPFISGETATYLRQYFQPGKIQVLEDHFCNHNALPSIIFNEDLDYLVEHSELHKGKILQLWPWGYKVVLKRINYITLQKFRFFWQNTSIFFIFLEYENQELFVLHFVLRMWFHEIFKHFTVPFYQV